MQHSLHITIDHTLPRLPCNNTLLVQNDCIYSCRLDCVYTYIVDVYIFDKQYFVHIMQLVVACDLSFSFTNFFVPNVTYNYKLITNNNYC